MSSEIDPKFSQPERHPFKTQWSVEGTLSDVMLRFFWDVPLLPEDKRRFEDTLERRGEELIDACRIDDLGSDFNWRTRSRPKGVPKDTPRAHKVSVYGDFVAHVPDGEELDPIHELLDALHNFQPPIKLVKIELQ